MEPKGKASPASIVGIVGGALLILGSVLTWVTVSFDTQSFAQTIADKVGVDVSQLGTIPAFPDQTAAGTKGDGKWTLVAGIVVIVCAIMLITAANLKKVAVRLMLLGGVVGVAFPLYNVLTSDRQIDDAVSGSSALTSGLSQLGLSTQVFKDALSIKWGIGVWVCVAGGILALVAGVMAMRAPAPAMTAPAMTSAGGFGAPMGSTAAAPPPPVTGPPPSSAPMAPPETTPAPPAPDPGPEPPTG